VLGERALRLSLDPALRVNEVLSTVAVSSPCPSVVTQSGRGSRRTTSRSPWRIAHDTRCRICRGTWRASCDTGHAASVEAFFGPASVRCRRPAQSRWRLEAIRLGGRAHGRAGREPAQLLRGAAAVMTRRSVTARARVGVTTAGDSAGLRSTTRSRSRRARASRSSRASHAERRVHEAQHMTSRGQRDAEERRRARDTPSTHTAAHGVAFTLSSAGSAGGAGWCAGSWDARAASWGAPIGGGGVAATTDRRVRFGRARRGSTSRPLLGTRRGRRSAGVDSRRSWRRIPTPPALARARRRGAPRESPPSAAGVVTRSALNTE